MKIVDSKLKVKRDNVFQAARLKGVKDIPSHIRLQRHEYRSLPTVYKV